MWCQVFRSCGSQHMLCYCLLPALPGILSAITTERKKDLLKDTERKPHPIEVS